METTFTALYILVVIGGLFIVYASVSLIRRLIEQQKDMIATLQEEIKKRDALIADLRGESSKRNRAHTYPTAAGLEDAISIVLDVQRDTTELEMQVEAARQRSDQLIGVLQKLREGPHAYDPERPAGRRPQPQPAAGGAQ